MFIIGSQLDSESTSSISQPQSETGKVVFVDFYLTLIYKLIIFQSQIKEKNVGRPSRIETASASSELSDSLILSDDRQRSRSRQSQSQSRTLSNSSVANLLTNLQNIQLPSTSFHSHNNEQQEEEDDSDLQLLIDLARDTDSARMDKLNRLHLYVEDSIGMVELLSLFRFIKSSSSEVNINEPPLNIYSSILPTLSALVLLENDI